MKAATPVRQPSSRVTPRAVALGLIGVLLICSVEAYSDYWINNTWLAAHHFPIAPLFLLVLLVLGNGLLQSSRRVRPLSSAELTTVWSMMLVTASLPTLGLAAYLIPTLVGVTYFATPENEWAELFLQHLPDWLIVKDRQAAADFYEGLSSGRAFPWGVWIRPLVFWSAFTLILWWTMACLATLFRREWVERERFVFPLVQLPQQLVEPPPASRRLPALLKSPALWIGALIPALIHTISTLHYYIPAVPEIPIRFSTWSALRERPWTELRPLDFNFQFSTIGLTYLMALEVSFSLWFFYLFYKLERVIALQTGAITLYYQDFEPYREMGAYLVLFLFFLWHARSHFSRVLRRAFGREKEPIDADEPLTYRQAVFGLILGLLLLTGLLMLAGARTFWLMLAVLAFFAVVMVVDAWVVTRGLFFIHGAFKAPDLFFAAMGTKGFGAENLRVIAFPRRVFFRDRREILMPHLVNAFKIADYPGLSRRSLHGALWIALLVGMAVSLYAYLRLAYAKGAVNLGRSWIHVTSPQEPFRELAGYLINPRETDWLRLSFVLAGGGIMGFLLLMQNRYLNWPLHPIGFITVGQFPLYNIWFSIFLGWLVKYLLLKQGGLGVYHRARPFFLGLVLGESCIGGLWAVVGLFTGKGYNFLYF